MKNTTLKILIFASFFNCSSITSMVCNQRSPQSLKQLCIEQIVDFNKRDFELDTRIVNADLQEQIGEAAKKKLQDFFYFEHEKPNLKEGETKDRILFYLKKGANQKKDLPLLETLAKSGQFESTLFIKNLMHKQYTTRQDAYEALTFMLLKATREQKFYEVYDQIALLIKDLFAEDLSDYPRHDLYSRPLLTSKLLDLFPVYTFIKKTIHCKMPYAIKRNGLEAAL